MDMSRRRFIKSLALSSALAAATNLFPGISFGARRRLDLPSGMIE